MIAESEETAVIFGMPQQAIRTGAVDACCRLHEIAASILSGVARAKRERAGEASDERRATADSSARAEELLSIFRQGRRVHPGAPQGERAPARELA